MASELFTSSITSRRFPALRGLTADDVEVMALPQRPTPDRKAKAAAGKGNRLFDPDLVKPSAVTNLCPMAGARSGLDASSANAGSKTSSALSPKKQQDPRPPFRPTGAKQGRESITVERHGFVLMHSPFDMGFRQRQQERLKTQNMRLAGGFHPPSLSQAKGDVSVNYYLNSADAETLEAERRYIQEKVRAATPSRRPSPPAPAPPPSPESHSCSSCPAHASSCAHACAFLARAAGEKEHDRLQPTYAHAARCYARGCQPRCETLTPPHPPPPHTRQCAHTTDNVPNCPSMSCALSLYSWSSTRLSLRRAPSQLAPWPDGMCRAGCGRAPSDRRCNDEFLSYCIVCTCVQWRRR